MKKKALSLALALVMCLVPITAYAADQPTSGTCGDGLTWTLNNGTLTISGTGAMADYGLPASYDRPPWPVANKTITAIVIDNGVTSIGKYAFYLEYSLASVTIPGSVTSIGDRAFMGCSSLTSVIIPGSVASIGESAFRDTGLTDLTLSNGITNIGENAFTWCDSLTSVAIPDSVTSIGGLAFSQCSALTSVTIPNSVTKIGNNAFSSSGLTSVTIPSNVASLGSGAFSSCGSLASVIISGNIADIGAGAFMYCGGLTSIQAAPTSQTHSSQDGVLFSKDGKVLVAYPGGKTGAYTIPDGVTSIESQAFMGCTGLTSVTIPNSVTSIGSLAFDNCSALASAAIPSSVTSIEWGAFYDCTALNDIYYGGTEQQWKNISFDMDIEMDDPLTSATIHYNSAMPEQPTQPQQPAQPAGTQAMPTNDKLTRDGEAQDPTVYKIGDSNYFKIRDLAAILNGTDKQFSVGYDSEKQSVTVTTGEAYTMTDTELKGAASSNEAAEVSNDAIYVNGQKVEAEVYKIGGNNYFKLRDLGKALDFYVGWSADKGMYIDSGRSYDADQ